AGVVGGYGNRPRVRGAAMSRRAGFTLAELMVVISIIALLVAIVVPQMATISAQARCLLCENNLKRIGQATQTWASDSTSWNLEPLAQEGWPGLVTKYTHSKEVLRCPEGGELKEGRPVEDQIVIRISPTSNVAVPLVGLMDGGGFKVIKLSQTQWNSGIAECARFEPVPYVPDNNPNVYWWGFDDGAIGRGDYDFQDLAIRVTKHGDGTASIYVTGATAGHPEVWTADLTKCLAPWQQINRHYNKSAPGATFKLDVGGASHYGMNVARLDMRRTGKIQALDYASATAYSTDDWDNPEWDEDQNGQPDFLRHRGRINVLFLGGSVKLMYRDDVDPADIEIERELWQP
ncbi:MAG: type II secretion system protein, partial [Planctomycetes bacterium]|nr:type II secretion system protein [Planctomycetota bacterium]